MDSSSVFIPRIDGIGGICAVVGVCVVAWFSLLKSDSAADELEHIRDSQLQMHTEHSRLQKAIQRNVSEWRKLKRQAEQEGKLDEQMPVQDRLRAVRELADQHGWADVHIMPVQWRSAIDVAEQTFSINSRASFRQMVAFFAAFERSDTWADISHLTVTPPAQRDQTGSAGDAQAKQDDGFHVDLILNFYSSYVTSDES